MKKRITNMIPLAMKAIEGHFTKNDVLEEIPKTFHGSISGMGASIMQMGLLPTLAVFAADENRTNDDQRAKLLKIIAQVLDKYENGVEADKDLNAKAFFRYVTEMDKQQQLKTKALLMDAAIAVKLSIRTFKMTENEQ